jgi:hypothetical protein
MYNFAFTLSSSPFGKVYYDAIEQKLDPDTRDGIFIVTVDPWAISMDTNLLAYNNPDSISVLNEIHRFSSRPNIEYLIKKYHKGWGNIALKKMESYMLRKYRKKLGGITGSWTYVNDDGWLDVSTSMDSAFVQNKIVTKAKAYAEVANKRSYSDFRLNALIQTIELLNRHGEVYLIRLPAHDSMLKIERKFMPDFNNKINDAIGLCSGYYDMNTLDHAFRYTDGNHLYVESGIRVSQLIAEWIKGIRVEGSH